MFQAMKSSNMYMCGHLEYFSFFLVLAVSMRSNISISMSSTADLTFSLLEEQIIGTVIGTVMEIPNLFQELPSHQRRQMKFGVLDANGYPASLFKVDETTGEIIVRGRIDREDAHCFKKADCILEFNVVINSMNIPFSNIMTIAVIVQDKNDNPPYFSEKQAGGFTMKISEAASIESHFYLNGAADRDYLSDFTVKRYILTDHNDIFSVSATTNLDGSSLLNLVLLKELDRETVGDYSFSILAEDGGVPPLRAELIVLVLVEDENDNAPVFNKQSYAVMIKNEVMPGDLLLSVLATDRDGGHYGTVTYQVRSLQRDQILNMFHVDETTGRITATSSLSPGNHRFVVEALDGGDPPLRSQAAVTVQVVSTRNYPPVMTINTLSDGKDSFVEVAENATLGSFVAFVMATDADDGHEGDVTCRVNNKVLNLSVLGNKGYTLSLRKSLNREQISEYNVTVTCHDNGIPSMSSEKTLKIIVTDINDNPPVFTSKTFLHSVSEGNYSNRHILQVKASDADNGKNGKISFTMETSARQLFRINRLSGIISAHGYLDRETEPSYTFKVYAADLGDESLTATARVSITLEDVNDQYPTFNRSIFQFRIPEDAQVPSVVGHLAAYDNDIGVNGEFDFFYAGSIDGADPFVVESDGVIWSAGVLDRETRDSFSFTVMVRDRGLPPKSNYASVVVSLLDVNDNAPIIQFPATDNHSIYVNNIPEQNMVLAKIVAYDSDLAENGTLRFSLLSASDDGAIDIDPIDGRIHVRDVRRLKNRSMYWLRLVVEDNGLPPKRSYISVIVYVDFDNSSVGLPPAELDNLNIVDDYVLIVATVAGTTVILSAVIVAAICFIFRQDRQYSDKPEHRDNSMSVQDEAEFFRAVSTFSKATTDNSGTKYMKPGNDYDEKRESNSSQKHPNIRSSFPLHEYKVDNASKQLPISEAFKSFQRPTKEVTFAGGWMQEVGSGELSFSNENREEYDCTNDKNISVELRPKFSDEQEKMPCGKKELMYKQNHFLLQRQHDDIGSDTGSGDSGHGVSEDDVNVDKILNVLPEENVPCRVIEEETISADAERYSSFPHHKSQTLKPSYHVHFDVSNSSPTLTPVSKDTTSLPVSVCCSSFYYANHTTVQSRSTPLQCPPTANKCPLDSRSKSLARTQCPYKEVSFTLLSQRSPQKVINPCHSPTTASISLSTFCKPHVEHRVRESQAQARFPGNDGNKETSSNSNGIYDVDQQTRNDFYVGTDVIV